MVCVYSDGEDRAEIWGGVYVSEVLRKSFGRLQVSAIGYAVQPLDRVIPLYAALAVDLM